MLCSSFTLYVGIDFGKIAIQTLHLIWSSVITGTVWFVSPLRVYVDISTWCMLPQRFVYLQTVIRHLRTHARKGSICPWPISVFHVYIMDFYEFWMKKYFHHMTAFALHPGLGSIRFNEILKLDDWESWLSMSRSGHRNRVSIHQVPPEFF